LDEKKNFKYPAWKGWGDLYGKRKGPRGYQETYSRFHGYWPVPLFRPVDVRLPCSPQKLRSVETTMQHIRNNYYRRREEDWIPAKTAMEASRWLEENYRWKFFLYLDFFDPHEPWDPPRWYVDMYDPCYEGEEVVYPAYGPCSYLTQDELLHIRALYAGEAALVDRWIGFLLEKMSNLGLFENTTIVFTSDHGFYLGEHGPVGKSVIIGRSQGLAPLYEEVAHIPLLIRFPDNLSLRKSIKINALVQTPDVTATVLDLAGVKSFTGGSVQGKSVLPLVKGKASSVRDIAVSTPSLIKGVGTGLRATVTTDKWSLILAPGTSMEDAEKIEITFIVDGEPRTLKPVGKINTELYNLQTLSRRETLFLRRPRRAKNIQAKFIGFLSELGASRETISPWLKCRGLN